MCSNAAHSGVGRPPSGGINLSRNMSTTPMSEVEKSSSSTVSCPMTGLPGVPSMNVSCLGSQMTLMPVGPANTAMMANSPVNQCVTAVSTHQSCTTSSQMNSAGIVNPQMCTTTGSHMPLGLTISGPLMSGTAPVMMSPPLQSPGNSSQNTTNMIPAGTVLVSPQGGGIGQTLPPGTMISGPNMNSVSGTVTPGQITGAINLTIANGAINFKPAMMQGMSQPHGTVQGQIVKGNNQAGLAKLMPQQQAINLKIPSGPMNMRLSAPNNQAGGMRGTMVAAPHGTMVIGQASFKPGPGGTQLLSQGFTPGMAQVAQLQLPQGTVFPPGARLVAQLPTSGQMGLPQLARFPIRGAQPLLRATTLPSGLMNVQNFTTVPAQSIANSSLTSSHPVMTSAAPTSHFAAPGNSFPISGVGISNQLPTISLVPAHHAQGNVPVHLTKMSPPSVISSASKMKNSSLPSTSLPSNTSMAAESQKTAYFKQQNTKPDTEEESGDIKADNDFDAMNAMEWKDGVGSLPGSDLKFRVNEFGMIEMITEGDDGKDAADTGDFDNASVSSAGDNLSRKGESDICSCENCGVHGLFSEFLGGGRFCSKQCFANFACKKLPGKNGTKGKKRKMSNIGDSSAETGSKVMRINSQEDDESKKMKKTKGFNWQAFKDNTGAVLAPPKAFKDPYPVGKNGFKVGMKLEGIDPRHPSLYCVLTVAEVKGYRLRLHFDGYSECYDFWCNADSPFIFPPGWSEKNGKKLLPPKGFTTDNFSWPNYLKMPKCGIPAPKNLFINTQAASVTPHGFRLGMKLEAVDKKNNLLTCVATVTDVLGDRILIYFDGWEDTYDYWCDPTSPYIHPVGWCQENAKILSPPNDYPDIAGFTWENYLSQTLSSPVPSRAFKSRMPVPLEIGMRVEAVDRRNPQLIRVATIKDIAPYRFLLHFDGWSDVYEYWVDDDCPDLHPPGWCARSGHSLKPPISPEDIGTPKDSGCPTPGCTGVGHIKGAKYTGHHSAFGCPYSPLNMNKECALQDRLGPGREPSDNMAPPAYLKQPKREPSPEKYPYVSERSTLGTVEERDNIYTQEASNQEVHGKCPTPGCDGQGHITGKYTAHHRLSGCPLAEKTVMRVTAMQNQETNNNMALVDDGGKPLVGPGSGRGRKKSRILKLLKKQKELQEQTSGMRLSQEPVNGDCEAGGGSLYDGIHQSVFLSAMLPLTTSRDLPLCWEHHSKLLPALDRHEATDVTNWSAQQVAQFVSTLPGCRDLGRYFLEEQIDGEAFLLLNQADIVRIMNIRLGPAIKIYNAILTCKNNADV